MTQCKIRTLTPIVHRHAMTALGEWLDLWNFSEPMKAKLIKAGFKAELTVVRSFTVEFEYRMSIHVGKIRQHNGKCRSTGIHRKGMLLYGV